MLVGSSVLVFFCVFRLGRAGGRGEETIVVFFLSVEGFDLGEIAGIPPTLYILLISYGEVDGRPFVPWCMCALTKTAMIADEKEKCNH